MKPKCYFGILLFALFICVAGTSIAQSPDWLWAKSIGGGTIGSSGGRSIAVDPETGEVYTLGSFSGTVDFDPGVGIFNLTSAHDESLFISKLDGSGNFVWVRAIGGTGIASGSAMAFDSGSRDLYFTGSFSGTIDFDPGAGIFNLTSAGDRSMFISKFDRSGNFTWVKSFVGTGESYANSIALDTVGSGYVYTTGSFSGTVDFDPGTDTFHLGSSIPPCGIQSYCVTMFISKLDGSGNFVWAKAMVGTTYELEASVLSIAVDPGSGDVCTTGAIYGGTVDFDPGPDTFLLGSFLPPCGHYACFTMFISKLDSSGNFLWAKEIQNSNSSRGVEIAFDPSGSGDVYTTGFFSGISDFDPGSDTFNLTSAGNSDIFISKLDSSGNFVWAKAMGGSGSVGVNSIAIDPSGSGDVYTTGEFYGTIDIDPGDGTFNLTSAGGADMFISKIDNSGNFIWAKVIGGNRIVQSSRIAIDSGSGAVYIIGSFKETVDFDPGMDAFYLTTAGENNMFISKLDGSGNFVWVKAMGASDGAVEFSSIAVDPTGGDHIYTIGSFSGTIDFDLSSDTFNLTAAGSHDICISRLDGSGIFFRANSMGGIFNDVGHFVAVDPGSGALYFTGEFTGTVDFDPGPETFLLTSVGDNNMFVSKWDGSGNFVWVKSIDGPGFASVIALAVDPGSGAVYSTGRFTGTVDFDPGPGTFPLTTSTEFGSMFIYKLDDSGNFVWVKSIDGPGYAFSTSIVVDPGSRDVYTTGWFLGDDVFDFDPGTDTFYLGSNINSCLIPHLPLYSPVLYCNSMFISKLDSLGNFVWAKEITKEIDGWGGSEGVSIALDVTGSGDIYTTGSFIGTVDFDPGTDTYNLTSTSHPGYQDMFISKLDSSGNFLWAKAMGGSGYDASNSIAFDPSGSGTVYTTGEFSGTVDFEPGAGIFNLTSAGNADMFLSKLDGSGNFIWAKAIGGILDDYGSVILLDAAGYVNVLGSYDSPSISFGSTILTNTDTLGNVANYFIGKLDTAFTVSVADVDFISNKITIYPNPATNELTIAFDESESLRVGITMFNVLGAMVFSSPVENVVDQKAIDISSLAPGIYFIELNIEGNKVIEKVVKE